MPVLILGAVLLVAGFLLGISLLVTAGIVLLLVGAVLMFMGGGSGRGWRQYTSRPRRRRRRSRQSW
jgi:hypothetical protein